MLSARFAQSVRVLLVTPLFFLVLGVTQNVHAAPPTPKPASDVGFMPGTMWVSDDTPTVGQTITLYTVVYNGSDGTLVGTVEFLDGTTLLGRRDISLANGEVKDVSLDWKATLGTHTFSVVFVNAQVSNPGKETADVSPTYATSKTPLRIVVKGEKNNLTAQALRSQEVLQLDTIDTLQKKVTEKIPPEYTTKAKIVAQRVEIFRMTMYFVFEEKRAIVEHTLNKDALTGSAYAPLFEKGKTLDSSVSLTTAQTAYAYGQLGFFSFLSWFYGTFYAFYVLGSLMLIFLIRSIWRLVRG